MYYVKEIEDKVRVTPDLFKEKTRDAVNRIIRKEYERRVFKEFGVVLAVYDTEVLSDGLVIPGDGAAYYNIKFKALTFMPYVNEVYETEIKDLVDFGAFSSIGPLQGLVHISQIGNEKFYHNKKLKKIASKSGKKSLKKGDKTLVKVSTVSLKVNISDTKIGLTMRAPGLGKPEWFEEKRVKKSSSKRTRGRKR